MTPVTRKVRVRVPATSANLGSGFDTVGLALDYHDELEFTLSADPVNTAAQVMIEGEGADTLPRDETHLVVSTFRRACQTFGLGRVGFILQAHNNIPQARGMGSSASSEHTSFTVSRRVSSSVMCVTRRSCCSSPS